MDKSKRLYFDHHSATFPSPTVLEAYTKAASDYFAHPLSPYTKGQHALRALKPVYEELIASLGLTSDDQIIFTSSGTEAINHLFWTTYLHESQEEGKTHFLTSQLEEAPSVIGLERLSREFSISVSQVPVNAFGVITKEALIESITPRTALLSVSLVNGMTGVIQPIEEWASILQERGVLLHVDLTHALGKIPLENPLWEADFLSFDAFGIHAPQGIGALIARGMRMISPWIVGGAEQNGKRAGSWNIPGLLAFKKAMEEASEYRDFMGTEVALLRDQLERGLEDLDLGVRAHFTDSYRLPNVAFLTFEGVTSDLLLYRLNKRGVSACFGGGNFQQISLIAEACKIPKPDAKSALSFTFSRWHTEEDIEMLITIIKEELLSLRRTSEYWKEAWD